MLTSRSRSPLPTPLMFALAGLAFAVWNAWDAASVPCLSAGCTLYQTFTINGFSLWWGGAAGFALLAAFALAGQAGKGRLVAGVGLVFDCVLLVVMLMTLPCVACMLAALLLALCYGAFRHAATAPRRMGQGTGKTRISLLLSVWSVFFVMLIGLTLNSASAPWALREAGDEDATVHIFFSPSCSACRQLVSGMPEAEAAKVAWYPVAETEDDLAVILALKKRLAVSSEPMSVAFAASLNASRLSFFDFFSPEILLLRFRLWRNQARVIDSGEGQLPFVEFRGLPQALIRPSGNASSSRPGGMPAQAARPSLQNGGQTSLPDATLPIDLGDAGSCGGQNATPCP